jgi:hypothetical protein
MNGYVKNKSNGWRHAMKRSIGPGQEVSLDELFDQYREKHDLKEGKPFVDWINNVKLKDKSVWEVVFTDGVEKEDKVDEVVEEKQNSGLVSPLVKKDMEVSDVVGMSIRKARVDLKKITDIKLLKYALNEAKQLANKDTLCIMIRKRINELEITRR